MKKEAQTTDVSGAAGATGPDYWNSVDVFLDKRGVAALLKCCPRTVDAMLARGELPAIRLSPRLIRFPRAAVLEALNRRVVGVK